MAKWRKGVSGNPSGRPAKPHNLTAALEGVVDLAELAAIVWRCAREEQAWAIALVFKYLEPQTRVVKLQHEITHEPKRDFSRLSTEELSQLASLFERSLIGPENGPGGIKPTIIQALPPGKLADD